MEKQRLGQIYLAISLIMAILFAGRILAWFETFDHFLNKIAFILMTEFSMLPQTLTHNAVMALGFAALGFAMVFPSSFLGVKRGWIVVGLILLALNNYWWYTVEIEVARETGNSFDRAFGAAVLYTYIANTIGAFAGAYGGEALVFYFHHPPNQQD